LRESLIKTLQRKFDISKRETLRRFGTNIAIKWERNGENKTIDFRVPNLKRNPMLFMGVPNKDPLDIINYEIRTIDTFGSRCANCNSKENIEMHHVKHIRTINPSLNPFDKLLARINRKQVPLCSKCHREVHKGKFAGKSLRY